MGAQHLTPWKPGQSGNPAGKSKVHSTFQELCREYSPKLFAELKYYAFNRKQPKHALKAIEDMLAYAHGRPAVNVNVRTIRRYEDLSDEELRILAGDNTIEGEVVEGPPSSEEEQ